MRVGFTPESTIVARPFPSAMEWLRTMFQPIQMRPMLPVKGVAHLLRMRISTLRAFFVHYKLTIHNDPVFGEVVSLQSVYHLQYCLLEERSKDNRFDRMALTQIFITASDPNRKILNYNARVEREIARICKMKEPDRTIRAVAFFEAYEDAKTISAFHANYSKVLKDKRIERRFENISKAAKGEEGWGLLAEKNRLYHLPKHKKNKK